VIEITLTSNASTGYSWPVASKPKSLRQKGKPVMEASKAEPAMPGTAGTTTFRFVATRKVTGKLILAYARSFEKDKPADKTYTVDFGAKPNSEKPC
jgi:predicted secreted protein